MRYHHPSLYYRLRAEAVLLNSRGFSDPKISQVIEYERKLFVVGLIIGKN